MSKLENAHQYCEAVREFTGHREVMHETIGSGHTIRVHLDADRQKIVVGVFDTRGAFRMGFDLR